MSRPTLSILIPTKDRADYLRQCLDSLQSVTVDCEIVVSDNASTDGTQELLADYGRRDGRLRVHRHAVAVPVSENFNTVMALGEGRYFCLLGDDDASLPGNFERKVAVLERHPEIGLIYSRGTRIDAAGREHGTIPWPGQCDHSYLGGRDESRDLLTGCHMQLQSVVFRRDLWERLGGFAPEEAIGAAADWDMLMRYSRATRTAFLAEPLVLVRFHGGSGSASWRQSGMFARGRIAFWRRWLVEADEAPVLAPGHWEQMLTAFIQDLDYELGPDREAIAGYLADFAAIREAHARKHATRLGDDASALDTTAIRGRRLCPCWRCRVKRALVHRQANELWRPVT